MAALFVAVSLSVRAAYVNFIFRGITQNMGLSNVTFFVSDSEKLLSYDSKNRDFSYLPGSAAAGFRYEKTEQLNYNGTYYYTTLSFNNVKGNKMYYRYYSPQFTDVQTGSAELIRNGANYVAYIDPLENKKPVTVSVKGRAGLPMSSWYLTGNINKSSLSGMSAYRCNYAYVTEGSTYTLFAEKGKTLEYAVSPMNSNCALVVSKFYVTDDDQEQTIEVDYSKQKKLRLFVSDSQGKYITFESKNVGNTYYTDECTNYGWGCAAANSRSYEVKASADGSYSWIETYAMPGSKINVEFNNVQYATIDEDFVFPYNSPLRYLVKEVEVTDDAADQDVLMGQSDTCPVVVRLKDAARFESMIDVNVQAKYDFKHYPFAYKWSSAYYEQLERTVDGDDVVFNLSVNNTVPHLRISPSISYNFSPLLYSVAVTDTMDFTLPAEKGYYVNLDIDCSKLHAVKFVARHEFMMHNRLYLSADILRYDKSLYHPDNHFSNDNSIDTLCVLMSEGSYEWYTEAPSTASAKHAFEVDAASDNLVIVIDELLTGIAPVSRQDNSEPQTIYTPDGKCVSAPRRGVNIIRMSDGTSRKVLR